jgi:omega-amidase
MSLRTVAAVQFDIAWEDKPASRATIEGLLDEAALPPGSLVVLPEMAETGFSMNLDVIVDASSRAWAIDLAARRDLVVQHGYATRGRDDRGRNVAMIASPAGEASAPYEKVHPFGFGGEARHYGGGDELVLTDVGGMHVCPLICYDLRFPELWRLATMAGAEVFTLGANWPAARTGQWRSLVIARAIENQAFVIACNRAGNDPSQQYAGGSLIVSPHGEVLAEAGGGDEVIRAEIDMADLRSWRNEFPALQDVLPGLLGAISIRKSPFTSAADATR